MNDNPSPRPAAALLLLIAGLGGLLYGIDVGIIAGALPYLEATSELNSSQLSFVVAAVLLGSVFSTLFSGMLADLFGRRPLMMLSGVLFILSIPAIALAQGYWPLVMGRLLQGVSAGLVGVVVPLYLAECLGAENRGKGTGVFQWLLSLGIVAAAVIGYVFSLRVATIEKLGDPMALFAFKDTAWRSIFWVSLAPGIFFVLGTFFIPESPRWLFRRGRKDQARAALLKSRTREQTDVELQEMEAALAAEKLKTGTREPRESLLHRKYVQPFVLACVILACNQTTGINSIIGYNATILIQAGLSDAQAHLGYVILTMVNFLMTMVGIALVDRKGRKFLLSVGSAGVIVSLIGIGTVFWKTEQRGEDVRDAIQKMVSAGNRSIDFNAVTVNALLGSRCEAGPSTLIVIYSCGDFHATTKAVRSDAPGACVEINRADCLPSNPVAAFFQNPFADLKLSSRAPLVIDHAMIKPVPTESAGWTAAFFIFTFMAFFSVGPAVCVWLALSELMPTRIRSNGMSIALVINQAVSTAIAAVFLPNVGQYGYSSAFFFFAACTVVYFVTATFFLPETKGKTLEEIEAVFERSHSGSQSKERKRSNSY